MQTNPWRRATAAAVAVVAASLGASLTVAPPPAAQAGTGQAGGEPEITVAELGRLDGRGVVPIEINGWGQVIGAVLDDGWANPRPVLAHDGVVTDLAPGGTGLPLGLSERGHVAISGGTTGPSLWHGGELTRLPGDGSATAALDVNAWGQVLLHRSSDGWRTTVWRSGTETEVSSGEGVGPVTPPGAITDLGQVIGGEPTDAPGGMAAYSWTPWGGPTPLGGLGGTRTVAVAANVWGQVVGTGTTADGAPRMFLWQRGEMVDLGTLGGSFSVPGTYPVAPVPTAVGPAAATLARHSVNMWGQVIGVSQTADGAFHGFVWRNGRMTDLGTVGDCTAVYPTAINDRGQVTGYCTGGASGLRGFLWDRGEMVDLGTAAEVGVPIDLDDRGRIVSSRHTDPSGPVGLVLTVTRR